MSFSSDILREMVVIQNRTKAVAGKQGIDAEGIGWEDSACVHASVDWQRGKSAMNAGALDAYGVVIVRMRWNNIVNMRSRIKRLECGNKIYQILPETFMEDRREDKIQFLAQIVIN